MRTIVGRRTWIDVYTTDVSVHQLHGSYRKCALRFHRIIHLLEMYVDLKNIYLLENDIEVLTNDLMTSE